MTFSFKEFSIKVGNLLTSDLSLIYGIGLEKSAYICSLLGLSQNFSTKNCNFFYFESFSIFVKLFYITDERIKLAIKELLNNLLSLRVRRGIRFFRNLPTRGQGTHRNAKQKKYLKKSEI